jgi:hypothetical protein
VDQSPCRLQPERSCRGMYFLRLSTLVANQI